MFVTLRPEFFPRVWKKIKEKQKEDGNDHMF